MTQPFLYSVEREYPHDEATLWSAWTDAAKLESWYHPTDLSSLPGATTSELQIGGLWTCAVDVPAFNMVAYFFGKYTNISERTLLEHTMHYTQSAEEFATKDFTTPSHLVTVDFDPRGTSTWVKYSQFGEMPEGQVDRTKAGMESYFDSLGNFLSA